MEHYQIVTARGVDSDSVLRKLAQEVGQNILKGGIWQDHCQCATPVPMAAPCLSLLKR